MSHHTQNYTPQLRGALTGCYCCMSLYADLLEINLDSFKSVTELASLQRLSTQIKVLQLEHIDTSQCFALKKIIKPSDPNELERFLQEFSLLKSLSHPNIIKLYSYKEVGDQIYALFEFMERKLKKEFKSTTETEAALIVLQVGQALEYLHSKKILHRDVNLSNILVSGKGSTLKAKLIGFEYAGDLNQQRITECGSLDSLAPEIINSQLQNEKVDTWGLGVIIYLLYGKVQPFFEKGENSYEVTTQNIRNCSIKYPQSIPPEIKEILEKVLVVNPSLRLSLTEIISHPYFKKYKEKLEENRQREYLEQKVADLQQQLDQKSNTHKSKEFLALEKKLQRMEEEFKSAQDHHDKQKLQLKETEMECMRLQKEKRAVQEYRMNLEKSKLQLSKINHNITLVVDENNKIKQKTHLLQRELEQLKVQEERKAEENKRREEGGILDRGNKSSSSLSKYIPAGSKEKPRSRNKSRDPSIPPLLNQSKSSRHFQ